MSRLIRMIPGSRCSEPDYTIRDTRELSIGTIASPRMRTDLHGSDDGTMSIHAGLECVFRWPRSKARRAPLSSAGLMGGGPDWPEQHRSGQSRGGRYPKLHMGANTKRCRVANSVHARLV